MSNATTLTCDGCDKKELKGDATRYWHHLILTYRNYDFIPAAPNGKYYDFCSGPCLQSFVKVMKFSDHPFSGLQ